MPNKTLNTTLFVADPALAIPSDFVSRDDGMQLAAITPISINSDFTGFDSGGTVIIPRAPEGTQGLLKSPLVCLRPLCASAGNHRAASEGISLFAPFPPVE